jgi:hypothetical protein
MRAWPEVGDALLVYSSTCTCRKWRGNPYYKFLNLARARENYHVVFNNSIGYEKCVHIILALADLNVLDQQFAEIRQFRGDMTLRVNEKPLSYGSIPPPEPVACILNPFACNLHGLIYRYLNFRWLVLSSDRSSHPQKTPAWQRVSLYLHQRARSISSRLRPRPQTRPQPAYSSP